MATILILRYGADEYSVAVDEDNRVRIGDRALTAAVGSDGSVRFAELPGRTAWAISSGDSRWVFLEGRVYQFDVERQDAPRKRASSHQGTLMAPMPATVRQIIVTRGDRVRRGDALVILEAMKMELPVKAGASGVVTAINCREGELVQPGFALVEVEAE